MATSKRILKEFENMQESKLDYLGQLVQEDENIFSWRAFLLPQNAPYNKGVFDMRLEFPKEYPFKPPEVTILTPIYHPNIDENGKPCLQIMSTDYWKPNLQAKDVFTELVALLYQPEPEHALRVDIAEQFVKNPKKFHKKAEEWTKKYAQRDPQRDQ